MNNKIVAVLAVALICVAAAAAIVYFANQRDDTGGQVSIVDVDGTASSVKLC